MSKPSLDRRAPASTHSALRLAIRGLLATAALAGALVGQDALAAGDAVTYIVQPGDTLGQIARRYGVETQELSTANRLASADAIAVGQALVVPPRVDPVRPILPERPRPTGALTRPAEGKITTYFKEPGPLWRLGYHPGLDIGAPLGAPILAAAGGTVVEAGWDSKHGYGNYVEIDHGGGMTTLYGHMSLVLASPGEVVAPGSLIGQVGSTGVSTGPHLHWEVRVDGELQDPLAYLS